jgi:hypothetical protein
MEQASADARRAVHCIDVMPAERLYEARIVRALRAADVDLDDLTLPVLDAIRKHARNVCSPVLVMRHRIVPGRDTDLLEPVGGEHQDAKMPRLVRRGSRAVLIVPEQSGGEVTVLDAVYVHLADPLDVAVAA